MSERVEDEAIPPASSTGRVLKLITGAVQVWYAMECMRLFSVMTHPSLKPGIWLAAITGLKGCEMRVIPYYLARMRGANEEAELCVCPGFWTPIDRWEARWRGVTA